jgi:hypothetical protein
MPDATSRCYHFPAMDISSAPPFDASNYPRTYRISAGYRAFFIILGGLAAVPGCLGVWYFGTGHEMSSSGQAAIMSIFCFLFVLLGAYLIIYALRTTVTLRADAIDVQEIFTCKTFLRADIAARRILPTQYVRTLVLIPRASDQKKLKFGLAVSTDAAFAAWLADFPDLDAKELAESREALAVDPDLGFNSEQRNQSIARAKKLATVLDVAAFVSFFWSFFFPRPHLLVAAILSALPLIALGLLIRSQGIYQIEGRRNDARPSLALVLIFPGLALAVLSLHDFLLLEWKPILTLSVLLALAMTLVAAKADPGARQRRAALVPIAIFGAFYTFGLIAQANSLLDYSSPQTFQVAVVGKHISSGKNTSYYLHLDPWGPQTSATQVTVPASIYSSSATGQQVCVSLHPGALRIPWYAVAPCS